VNQRTLPNAGSVSMVALARADALTTLTKPQARATRGLDGPSTGMTTPGGQNFGDQPPTRSTVPHLSQSHCGARTRAGTRCQSPPVHGRKRCRLHGGLSPGAPKGEKNGRYLSGDWTQEAIELRRWVRAMVRAYANVGGAR
jgi:glucans biosynthesis protein